MKLYGSDLSPFVQRVKMQIAAKGLEVEYLPPPGGGMKSEEFLAINPIGKIPCLVTDSGMSLPESEVILEYLEDAFPKPALRPRKPEERAQVRLISRVNDIYVGPAMGKIFGLMGPGKDPEAIKAALADVNTALGHLEHVLTSKKHAAGNKFSLADCTITPSLFFVVKILPVMGVKAPLKNFKKIAKYWKTREKDAVTVKAIEEMTAEMKARFGM
ncbi:glutathione S-transferase family protein [Aquidulcibacter sp.]|uniref:glutathione S-transferase family protein n=1 Tax=Aquidulcibacter sp. TaxID=2052990 RepID=UPI0025C0D765|nr:glutathione S-transferase family protein [Aquidulcibacter sp.]MCA3696699.1 glutathione S-transferase family protein [Aquidulcibacter sp.]